MFFFNVIIVSHVQCVHFNALIVLLVHLYSGINAGKVAWRVSGGECDGFRVSVASRPVT